MTLSEVWVRLPVVGGGAGTPFCSLPAGLHGALDDVKSLVGTGSTGSEGSTDVHPDLNLRPDPRQRSSGRGELTITDAPTEETE